jgi:hypothetical protein
LLGRSIKVYFYLLFIPFTLFSSKIALYDEPYWHTLLHFKDGESEIDSPSFFLSKHGKQSPKAELNATIYALKTDANQTFCKYPARSRWLLKKLPILKKEIGSYSCKRVDKLIDDFNPTQVSLIFPTAFLNSPASMYGHSFLRIDNDKKTPLLSQALNYSAQVDETNGLLFAYHGLFGGYTGRYSITPYYNKIKEYNDMEQRDMWEYNLNLNKEEIRELLYHQFELKDSYASYYFFTENCSYNLLWLLQIARPKTSMVGKFHYKAIPIDTIREVKENGFIKSTSFRPSKRKTIEEMVKKIKDKKLAKKFLETSYDETLLKDSESEQKVYILDFASQMLRFKRAKDKISKKAYTKELLHILKQRSKLSEKSNYTPQKPDNPLTGDKTNRLAISFQKDDLFLSFKPSYHDRYDIEKGFTEGAYINFFNLQLSKRKDKDIAFEKFTIVDISSFAPRDIFFKPLSWEVKFGLKKDDNLSFFLKGGSGYSYKKWGFLTYLFINPALYISKDITLSISPKVGLFRNFKSLKVGASFEREYFSSGLQSSHGEFFSTTPLSKDVALNLKYDITSDTKKGSISLFYYF